MSAPSAKGALVCGFWDEAAKLSGLAWAIGGSVGGLLLQGEDVQGASAEITDARASTRLRLETDGASCEAELTPRPGVTPLLAPDEAAPPGAPESATCGASVQLRADNGRKLASPGHLTRWGESPEANANLLRYLELPAADGALLVVLAKGWGRQPTHGAEDTFAWLLDAEGRAIPYSEALLSTQYDAEGRQTRVGLELWSEDPEAPPIRAAATALGNGPASRDGVTAALLRTSTEGTGGLGSYLIWRG